MSIILTAYSSSAFREYYLPAFNDEDYFILLEAQLFQIPIDVTLRLDVVENQWYLHNDKNLLFTNDGERFERNKLCNRDIFRLGPSKSKTWIAIIISERDSAIRSFGRIDLTKYPTLTIGRKADNHICYNFKDLNLISEHHAEIRTTHSGSTLVDISQNGTFLGNQRITGEVELNFGDMINVYGLTLIWLGTTLAIDNSVSGLVMRATLIDPSAQTYDMPPPAAGRTSKADRVLKRSPRTVGEFHTEPIEIEAPPQLQQQRKQPLLLTIGPAFTMVIPMMLGTVVALASNRGGTASYTGIIVVGAAGGLAVMWALLRIKNAKKTEIEDKLLRESQYGLYLERIEGELQKQTEHNRAVLLERYPSAAECAKYPHNKQMLWKRNFSHPDFLYTRLGLGSVPFQVPINVPKERFSLINDALAERPREIKAKFELIGDAPIGVDFMETRLVGIFGTSGKAHIISVARAIAVQIATNNCYTDVKMMFLYPEEERNSWDFAKWLPHVWSEGHKVRFTACSKAEASDILYSLAGVLRDRQEAADAHVASELVHRPHYVVFLSDISLIEDEPIAKYLLSRNNEVGVSTIVLSNSYDELPNDCTDLIQADETFCGMYDVETMDTNRRRIRFDNIGNTETDTMARELSSITVNETESGGEIPNSLSFFDMHRVSSLKDFDVLERWRKNRTYENMRALVGQRAGGSDVFLDIHEKYHGPHGLVAGTTGSGKSETIQTFMLSLALSFSPLDVGFFVIDFKGGGMANLFSSLPHMVGKITNLSGNAVRRAMVSIKSEIKRRQRIFSEFEVNHLDKYTRLLKAKEATIPLPHLLIIIDEFAELKREEPEFMKELISVAQVGRSLGVHLILATQKPAGVVDDSIWSNSKFKLCLRVQDKQDSNDMLKKPDAAYITQAGRCYMQVGNDEIFELFQSGWSGAAYDENAGNMHSEVASLLTLSGKKTEGKKRRLELKEAKRQRWMTVLVDAGLEAMGYRRNAQQPDVEVAEGDTVSAVFDILARNNIDYPVSAYNTKRIMELLQCIETAVGECGANDLDLLTRRVAASAAAAKARLPEEKELTQLTAVVDYLARLAEEAHMTSNLRLWLPELPNTMVLSELSEDASRTDSDAVGSLAAAVGLCDDPVNQNQFPLVVDLEQSGNIIVCGMAASGKSTFVQTLLYSLCTRYSPQQINVYIIDFSNKMLMPFDEAPHVGGIITEDEPDKLAKFFVMMTGELARRKRIFKGGSYSQYIRANGPKEPAIICVLDGYGNFREKTENAYDPMVKSLVINGSNYGIHMVIASGGFGAGDIQSYLADNIKSVYCLEMGDKFKYSDALHNIRLDVLPEAGVKGRGLVVHNGAALEFQTALAVDAEDDYARAERLERELRDIRLAWAGKPAVKIPVIPANPTWEVFTAERGFDELAKQPDLLPIGYNTYDASLFALKLSEIFSYMVVGKPRTGKESVMKTLMLSAKMKHGAESMLITTNDGNLATFAGRIGVRTAASDAEHAAFATELMNTMIERNKYKQELREHGLEQNEINDAMRDKFPPLFIFIADLCDFVTRIYASNPQSQSIYGFMENFIDKGELHNIYVFAVVNTADTAKMAGRRFYDIFAGRKTGMLTGGNAGEQRLLDFSMLPYREQVKAQKVGDVMLPPGSTSKACTVTIPQAKV